MFSWLFESSTLWYMIRSTGTVLVILFTVSIVLGVLATVRLRTVRWPRFATQSLHRNVTLLAMTLLVVHIVGAIMDKFVDIRWYEAFIPRPGAWKTTAFGFESPLWLWFGILANDLIVAVIFTSLIRQNFSHRFWRWLHLSSYVAWAFAILHGLGVGSDKDEWWFKMVIVICIGAVAAMGVIRVATMGHERELDA
jgi:predicted ferric reductase